MRLDEGFRCADWWLVHHHVFREGCGLNIRVEGIIKREQFLALRFHDREFGVNFSREALDAAAGGASSHLTSDRDGQLTQSSLPFA